MFTAPRIARIALVAALLGGVALALAPVGYRLGWWQLHFAFYYGLGGALIASCAALILALGAVIIATRSTERRGLPVALAAVLLSVFVGGLPARQYATAKTVPPIHDISTDTADPPVYVALAAARKAAPNGIDYGGAKVAEMQKEAYPDIATLHSTLPPAGLFAHAATSVASLGWSVAESSAADGRIEASDTTPFFGFTDDIVIRVRAADNGSALDVRSMSRIGKSDVGTNAARVRRFLARVKASGA